MRTNPARRPAGVALAAATVLAAPLAAQAPRHAVIRVPEARGTPVLLDGQLSRREWDDARAVPLSDSLKLLVKQTRGHVFVAIATGSREPRGIDVYLEDGGGRVHQLHASAQIGERSLRDTLYGDTVPAWRWGNHVDWIANEAKTDPTRPAGMPFRQRLYPADGTEFQIRRSRFTGDRWRVRIEVQVFASDSLASVFPEGATRNPATWMTLALE